ncbi:MAG: deoxyguanosinetriphosphate triphosphohydrolase [Candidatus Endonucleobacter bathymodioli]|uniref:Deoxyguanosinetriphosphate triphosphohydrolase n=1 Tax=Candidatus Endonucleibacter bathymodioli TaxID=539814 RepID=A0AA90NLW2_9GAMM|nr:deoxyguanosinetriphosphate triphosphohydrolase [Candidatus Endonucleobacter bathymodioli]
MWGKLLSRKRFYGYGKIEADKDDTKYRNSFHRDYDRLIFSKSFRRLAKKTQVHPLSNNDHVHDRLTHSLEVASVGRSLGLKAGGMMKNRGESVDPHDVAYIIQTACLAHDIGNPPFGHAGEEVIKEWFLKNKGEYFLSELPLDKTSDFQHLDGNAQSFRIVSQLEHNLFKGGMNLTFATLGALVKYPYSSDECQSSGKSKFNYFKSEGEFFSILFSELGLKSKDGSYKRHPFSYLMEVADDICYGLLDLQDAFELKVIDKSDMQGIFNLLCGKKKTEEVYSSDRSDINKVSKLVGSSVNQLALHAMDVYENNLHLILGEKQPTDLISLFSEESLKDGIEKAKDLGKNKIFNEKRKVELELGSFNIIETLLDHLIRATFELYTNDEKCLSFRNKRVLKLMGNEAYEKSDNLYEMYQRVIDYLVGMTDNHAKYIANQINGMG